MDEKIIKVLESTVKDVTDIIEILKTPKLNKEYFYCGNHGSFKEAKGILGVCPECFTECIPLRLIPKTALFIKKLKGGWSGDARLYKMTPECQAPVHENEKTNYVIVSANNTFEGDETRIFRSDINGDASFADYYVILKELNHEKILNLLGYDVIYLSMK